MFGRSAAPIGAWVALVLGALLVGCGPQPCLTLAELPEICESHPFGAAPGCGAERPQTEQACDLLVELNPDTCIADFIACREALRLAPCGICPEECRGMLLSCEQPEDDVPTG